MDKIDILIEGYARTSEDGTWVACCSTTLITAQGGKKVIVDPGNNRGLLLDALNKRGLTPGDVDLVFVTHHHLDHIMNVALFPQATVVDSETAYRGDAGKSVGTVLPGTDIKIVRTPGHEAVHASLLVTTEKGKVLVGGDIYWWYEDEEQTLSIEKADDAATDLGALRESRKKILDMADFLIPGHGPMKDLRVEREKNEL